MKGGPRHSSSLLLPHNFQYPEWPVVESEPRNRSCLEERERRNGHGCAAFSEVKLPTFRNQNWSVIKN
jgi:hypothetical protein